MGTSIPLFLEKCGAVQPFLLCVGENRKSIQRYFVIVDMKAIPCKAQTSVGAFDELFKAHFVFGTSYSESLSSFYIFIQTAIYNIDAGVSKERPRVREIWARFLRGKNWLSCKGIVEACLPALSVKRFIRVLLSFVVI